MAAPEKPPEMISAGLTNTWMAQAWIKAERSTAAIVITRRIFLSLQKFYLFKYRFQTACFSHIIPSSRHSVCISHRYKKSCPSPQKAALSHDQNRHTIKYCWHPHTKQKPVRHSFVLLTNVTIASFHSFVNLLCILANTFYFLGIIL